jgi:8-oxo-dGTP pyrophosphatase MutT (NUDIX family)
MSGTAAAVAPAATVVLLRELEDRLEVLLTKRAAGLAFMGGIWVFPGGRMEPGDEAPEVAERVASSGIEGVRQRMLDVQGTPIPMRTALGLHIAGCRETFEEAGVLLARPRAGSTHCDMAQIARMADARESACSAQGFLDLLVRENLVLEVDRLVYWAHWITPSLEKRRFDTRFFAIQVPPGQEASVDRSELTHHAWLGEQAIADHLSSGEMRLSPPTLATLQDLWTSHARHGGLESMLQAERNRTVPPILPKIARAADGTRQVFLPWDRDYGALPGEGCRVDAAYPDHLASLPSRRVVKP